MKIPRLAYEALLGTANDTLSAEFLHATGEAPTPEARAVITRIQTCLASARPAGEAMLVPLEGLSEGDVQCLMGMITGIFYITTGMLGDEGRNAPLANAVARAGATIIKARRAYANN